MIENIVILSTADFNAAVWTNKQHLANRLADHRNVIYIESLGLRRPKISVADAKRIVFRLIRKPTIRDSRKNIRIIKPKVIPFHGNKLVQLLNASLLRRQMRRLMRGSKQKTALWTFSPVTYGIENYFDKVVYHSVDLLHTQPRVPSLFLLESEKQLLHNTDVIIASSTGVAEHIQRITGRQVRLFENVADTALYSDCVNKDRAHKAVFAGNLTPTKIDFALLTALADAGVPTILAGPTAIDGTSAAEDLSKLLEHPGITHVGNLKPQQLATLLNACTVGIVPYVLNDYTTGVFPMKIYEYLASGLAVVSTQLPSLSNVVDPDIHLTERDRFVETVKASLAIDAATIKERKVRASSHSWDSRTKSALSILDDSGEVDVCLDDCK